MTTSHLPIFLRVLLGCVGMLLFAHGVQANGSGTQRGWIEDPSGSYTLRQVQEMQEQPLPDNLFGTGFSTSFFWIRIRIDPGLMPTARPQENLIIRIRPVYQDQIWLFDPLEPQGRERVTGDFYDWSGDEWQSLNLNFVIPAGAAPRDVWLRLRTNQALYTTIDVLTEREALAADRRQDAWSMFSLALLIFILAWGTLAWISQRDPLIGWFNLRTVAVITYVFFLLGYGRMFLSGWLPDPYLDRLFNISLWVFIAAALWFDAKLLEEFQANRWLIRAIRLLVIALPVELLMILIGRIHIGVQLNFLVTMFAIVLVFCGAISTRAWRNSPDPDGRRLKPPVPKYVFVSLYSMAILVVLYNRLALIRVIPPPENLLDYVLLYPLPISFFMMLLLQLRAHKLSQHHQAESRELAVAKREAEVEKQRRIEDERFISMLTHELKTPISVAKINLAMSGLEGKERVRIERALKNMTDVVERCRISAAMEDQRLQLESSTFNARTMVTEVLSLLGKPDRVKLFEVNDVILRSDSQLFSVVISNLLDNALKYSVPDSEISVRFELVNRGARPGLSIVVSNRVVPGGLPDASRLFTKYYRSRGAESKSGSGLGLYISAGLAQMLNGSLEFGAVDNCVEFEFWLPV